jgi:hypothetical protein
MKKYEQEIRELLEKMDTFVPDASPAEREREAKKKAVGVMPAAPIPITSRQLQSKGLSQWLRSHNISAGLAYLILSFGLVITGLILRQQVDPNNILVIVAQVLGIIGIILYLMPIILRIVYGRDVNNTDTKYWRGQPVLQEPIINWSKLMQKIGFGKNNKPKNNSSTWNDRNRSNRW